MLQKKVAEKSVEAVMHNFSSSASGYFGSIRIPATLITGNSLGFLFVFKHISLENKTTLEKFVLRLYHACVLFAFGLALTTVIISTSAYVSMLHGRYNPYATTAYEMMRREFDYEFSITRWCFLVSLLNFIGAVTTRVIIEFELLSPEKRLYLYALLAFMTSVTTNVLSYINRTMYCWGSLLGLTIHVMKLSFESLTNGDTSPLQLVSFASGLVAFLLIIKILVFGGTKVKRE